MRRIALYSDVHGNVDALDAVYADMAGAGVRERVCLGDLVGYGADPAGVIARVRASGDQVVQGNYDRGIGNHLGNCGCHYATEQAKIDGEASYEFTDRHVGDADAAWLAGLLPELRLEYHGVSILLCHGSPRRVNEYLLPNRTDAQLERLAREAVADVVCVGHVHMPYHRVPAPGLHYVSSGSVGKPKDGDPRACWVELVIGTEQEALSTGDAFASQVGLADIFLGAVFHRVLYDVESQVHAIAEAGLPASFGEELRRG